MRSTLAIALIALFITFSSAFEGCVAFSGFNAFNLCPFAKQNVIFNVSTAQNTEKISFSLADDHVPSCGGANNVYAVSRISGNCQNIAMSSPTYSLINKNNSKEGLVITFPSVDVSQTYSTYSDTRQVVVVLKCNVNKTDAAGTKFGNAAISRSNSNTIYTITGESSYACPDTADFFLDFIKEYKYIFACILIVLGPLFTFFGLKVVNYAIIGVAVVIGFALSAMFAYSKIDNNIIFWLLCVPCIIPGLALGYLSHKFKRVGFFFIGAALGSTGGYILYTGVIDALLNHPANSQGYRNLTQSFLFFFVGAMASIFNEIIFIISTSVVGSFFTAVALALFTGQFSHDDVLSHNFEFGQYKSLYIAGMVILSGCGLYYQHHVNSVDQEELDEMKKDFPDSDGDAYYRY